MAFCLCQFISQWASIATVNAPESMPGKPGFVVSTVVHRGENQITVTIYTQNNSSCRKAATQRIPRSLLE
ncbi:hypothetical protein GCM10023078_09920 [Gibbsiella greigii]